jgi:hypothetical protein
MNKQRHSALPKKMSPYEVFFGRKNWWESRVPQGRRALSLVEEVEVSSDDNEDAEVEAEGDLGMCR